MGLNLFDEFAAEFVDLCPQEEECTSSSCGDSKMYTPGNIGNSQTDRGRQLKYTKMLLYVAKVRILVERGIL